MQNPIAPVRQPLEPPRTDEPGAPTFVKTELIRRLNGDARSAIALAAIEWECRHRPGKRWAATQSTIAAVTGLSIKQVELSAAKLRSGGYLTAVSTSGSDRTLTYQVPVTGPDLFCTDEERAAAGPPPIIQLRHRETQPTPTAVYRFYDAIDRLLYVGITDDIERRLAQHAKLKRWYSQIGRTAIDWYPHRAEAAAAEAIAIQTESPIYNIAGRLR